MGSLFNDGRRTAHDRFKDSFGTYVWGAIAFSALIHFFVLSNARFDILGGYEVTRQAEIEQVELARADFEIPPPPERISRPAIPVISTDINISEDITIGEVVFDNVPIEELPTPPTLKAVDVSEQPAFTPYEVKPTLRNAPELQAALLRMYPPLLKKAGVGGVAILWIFIDEEGAVQNTRVVESSGYQELDLVAQQAVRQVARFTPALNRDVRVPVWIQMPVAFESLV